MRPAHRIGWLATGVLIADQLTKWWALQCLTGTGSVPVIPGVFHLTLVKNPGVAFGLLAGAGGWAMAAALVIVGALVLAVVRRPEGVSVERPDGERPMPGATAALGLILGGAVGNLLDRARVGAVVDFLDFRVWPVFNVADSCITIGAFLMAWCWWRSR